MFEHEVFKKYRVVGSAGLHLGQFELTLSEGAVVEFDGNTLKYGGKDYMVPALKGGVNAGWIVPVEDTISTYVPKPAGVRVKAAQSHGTDRPDVDVGTASEEEMVVGDVNAQKERRLAAAARPMTSAVPPAPAPPAAPVARTSASPVMQPPVATTSSPEMKEVTATVGSGGTGIGDASDGQVVGSVGQPAQPAPAPQAAAPRPQPSAAAKFPVERDGSDGVVVRPATAAAAAAQAAGDRPVHASEVGVEVGGYQFGAAKTSVNMANDAEVNEAKRGLTGASKNLGKAAPPERMAKPEDIPRTLEEGKATLVAAPAPETDIRDTPGGVTGDVSVATSGSELGELLPDAATAGATAPAPAAPPPAPFAWSTKGHWRERVTKAVKHADDPNAMLTILASESDAVKKHIRSEMTKLGKAMPV